MARKGRQLAGTGNRVEFWNNQGTLFSSKGKIRRYIDIGRLNKGR